MRKQRFVYLSFGRRQSYHQTLLSIFSLWLSNGQQYPITIATDDTDFFRRVLSPYVPDFLELDNNKLASMRGSIDFVHRIKISVIDEVARCFPTDDLLYLDSDTLVKMPLRDKLNALGSGSSLMHLREFAFHDYVSAANDPTAVLAEKIKGEKLYYKKGNRDTLVTADFSSWNAGAVGISASSIGLLKDVYALTDVFYRSSGHHASEQFAFSYVLEKHTAVQPLNTEILHYWRSVHKEVAENFCEDLFSPDFLNRPWQEKIAVLNEEIPMLEKLFHSSPLVMRHNALKDAAAGRHLSALRWLIKYSLKADISKPKFYLNFLRSLFRKKYISR